MTFEDYQANAMEFAVYKDKSYPFYALVEEVGEVFGKIAKAKRKGVEVDKPGLKKELGDVLWQLAACCKEVGIAHMTYEGPPSCDTEKSLFRMAWYAHSICEDYGYEGTVQSGKLLQCYMYVGDVASRFDWTLTEVMVENLYKLRDRQQRNVLVGEGDNR